ncbi:MAG: T9SS type A sorting domain-containing protein, partial [Ignavibacteriae bacterium]|nr:T9SS type A sorting domain-containing protein [Ignavibacteriota bacterium]
SLYSAAQDSSSLTPTDTLAVDRPLTFELSRAHTYSFQPFIKVLEDSGHVMEYCNNIDIDSTSSDPNEEIGLTLLSKYQMLVLWQHDEYWSRPERINTQTFKGGSIHGNIARFAPNTCYWRITWIDSSGHRQLTCYKANGVDLWRDTPEGPEAKFLGEQYQHGWNNVFADPQTEEPPDTVYDDSHWIFRGTALQRGDLFGYGTLDDSLRRHGIVSGELDNTVTARADFPLDTLAQRHVYSRLDSTGCTPCYQNVLHQMIYYEDTTTNARVFAQGASNWWLGLLEDDEHAEDIAIMKRITMNIFDHFSGKKYIGKVWTGAEFPLEWRDNVELDGNVEIPHGKYLKAIGPITVAVDSAFAVNGTLEINDSVTLAGPGAVHVSSTGNILLTSGATLRIKTAVYTSDSVVISVPSSTTLRIDTLGRMYFGVGSRINVSGTLVAQGTNAVPVLFTRNTTNNDYWSGITLNEFATATFNHCNIAHAQVGVIGSSVEPAISNCTFDSCKIGVSLLQSAGQISNSIFTNNNITAVFIDGEYDYIEPSAVPLLTDNLMSTNTTGIYITNSAPILEHNVIENNAQYGVACVNSGNPFVGRDEIDTPGNNIFEENGTANLFADASVPFLGYVDDKTGETYGGHNSFGPENHEYDILAQNESVVLARRNYWSEYPPDEETSFHIAGYGISTIDWDFALEEYGNRPNQQKVMLVKVKGLPGPPPSLNPRLSHRLIDSVMQYRSRKKYTQAVNVIKDYLAGNSSASSAPAAFLFLQQIVNEHARFARDPNVLTTFAGYRDSLLAATENDRLTRVILSCNRDDLVRRKRWSEAIDAAEEISNRYPNTSLNLHSLYLTVTANLFGLGNKQNAEQQFALLQQRFPQSELTAAARLFLDVTPNGTAISSSGVNKSTASATDAIQRPAEYLLRQNYPNPFNPSTTISYDVPRTTHVTLKVYDVLGKEIATLVNEEKEPGTHTLTWDARGVASGMYFYRISTSGFVQTNKMILVR